MILGRAPDVFALTSESAELWHRRMGHINNKSLDVPGTSRLAVSTIPATLRTVVPAHSGRAHNNCTTSRPPTMFYVLSSSYPSTLSAPSRLNLLAGSNTPSRSLTSKRSEKRWCS